MTLGVDTQSWCLYLMQKVECEATLQTRMGDFGTLGGSRLRTQTPTSADAIKILTSGNVSHEFSTIQLLFVANF